MDDAGSGDQLIGGVAMDVELCARPRDLDSDGPDVDRSERTDDGRIVEVQFNPPELGELRDFPKDDGRDAPAVASQKSALNGGEVSRESVDQNVGIKIEHAS